MSEDGEDISEQQNTSLIKGGGENGINSSFVAVKDEEKEEEKTPQGKFVTYKGKIIKLLQMTSLGKYRTPLYYKESESYSSIFGGIFSIMFILLMLIVGISIFYSIFTKDNYELSQKAQRFHNYKESNNSNDA